MHSAFAGSDIICKPKLKRFDVVYILKCHINQHSFFLAGDQCNILLAGFFGFVQPVNKGSKASLKTKCICKFVLFAYNFNANFWNKIRLLAKMPQNPLPVKPDVFKNFGVWLKRYGGTGYLAFLHLFHFGFWLTSCIFLFPLKAVAAYFCFHIR